VLRVVIGSNAKRPSPQRDDEGLMTHRENRTAHQRKSQPARSSHAHFGLTSHHCRCVSWSGMRVTVITGRSRSRNARRAEHATLELGGRLSHNNVKSFLHRRPPRRGKTWQGRHAETQVLTEGSYRLSHADQRLFFEQNTRLFRLKFNEASRRPGFKIADNFRHSSETHPPISNRSKCRSRGPL